MKQKIYNILETAYTWIVTLSLAAAFLSIIGFIVAVIVGGGFGATLATFLYKQYLAWVMFIAAIGMLCGLGALYISNNHALSMKTEGTNKDK